MGTDTRAIVDQLRNELRAARSLWIADRTVYVQHGRSVRIGVNEIIQVGPESLADNKVRNSVTVDVGES